MSFGHAVAPTLLSLSVCLIGVSSCFVLVCHESAMSLDHRVSPLLIVAFAVSLGHSVFWCALAVFLGWCSRRHLDYVHNVSRRVSCVVFAVSFGLCLLHVLDGARSVF